MMFLIGQSSRWYFERLTHRCNRGGTKHAFIKNYSSVWANHPWNSRYILTEILGIKISLMLMARGGYEQGWWTIIHRAMYSLLNVAEEQNLWINKRQENKVQIEIPVTPHRTLTYTKRNHSRHKWYIIRTTRDRNKWRIKKRRNRQLK